MSLTKDNWEEAIKAWEAVHKQALIDLEQSELYIKSIKKKLDNFHKV